MGKFYLVTGGLGFLGAALSRALLSAGHRVRVLDNSFRGSIRRLGSSAPDVEVVCGDIRDLDVVTRAVRGVDAVCHLAYVNGTRHFYSQPSLVLEIAVKGMMNVLDACRSQRVGELILASSSEVYQTPPTLPTDESVPLSVPDPLNPRYSYGGGKIISELMTLNYGREHLERAVIFRPHNVYGPDMGWEHVVPEFVARQLSAQEQHHGPRPMEFSILGDGQQTRAFIYIDDFTRGLMRVIEAGEHLGIYHIGTPQEHTIAEVAQLVARGLGLSIELRPGPAAPGATVHRCPDIRKLRQLGFEPVVSLAAGLELTVPWYRDAWHRGEGRHVTKQAA
ncbi:MAG: NAD-dependent epimerase/dehydratase family protein [Pirellulaceae bacterium]